MCKHKILNDFLQKFQSRTHIFFLARIFLIKLFTVMLWFMTNILMYDSSKKFHFYDMKFSFPFSKFIKWPHKQQFSVHISASCAPIALKLCTHLHLGTNFWFNKFRQGDRFIFSKTARQNVVFHDFLSFVNSTSCLNQALHPFRVFL